MNFLKKHSNKFAITLGAAALLVGGYLLFKRHQTKLIETKMNNININDNSSIFFSKDDKYHAVIEKLKKLVSAELAKGELSKKTVMMINQTIIYVFRADYIRNIIEGKKVRRNIINNVDLYVKEIMKYTTEAEKLKENAAFEVLRDLDITIDEYERNIEKVMAEDPNFAMLNLYMFESVKMQVPSDNKTPLTKEKLIETLNFQADNYNSINFEGLGISPQEVIMLKQVYLSDMAYLRFGIEEEDVMKNPALLQDPEVAEAHKKLQEVILVDNAGNMGY